MEKYKRSFDRLIFEVRYAFGHLYFDRCGQTLLDIEKDCEGWYVFPATPQQAVLEKPDISATAQFNSDSFSLTVEKANKTPFENIVKDILALWSIIKGNLALEDFSRIGCRFHFLLPTTSIEDSERLLKKSEFNLIIPKSFQNENLGLYTRDMVGVFLKEDTNYRVQLNGITRTEGMNPNSILRANPKSLSKKQREYRLAKLKSMKEYSANPMFAVHFDVDCYKEQEATQDVSVETFLNNQFEYVNRVFVPIVEAL